MFEDRQQVEPPLPSIPSTCLISYPNMLYMSTHNDDSSFEEKTHRRNRFPVWSGKLQTEFVSQHVNLTALREAAPVHCRCTLPSEDCWNKGD